MYDLVEFRGSGENLQVLDSSADLDQLYAVRDELQKKSLDSGHTMSEVRFAIRCVGPVEEAA